MSGPSCRFVDFADAGHARQATETLRTAPRNGPKDGDQAGRDATRPSRRPSEPIETPANAMFCDEHKGHRGTLVLKTQAESPHQPPDQDGTGYTFRCQPVRDGSTPLRNRSQDDTKGSRRTGRQSNQRWRRIQPGTRSSYERLCHTDSAVNPEDASQLRTAFEPVLWVDDRRSWT